MKVHQVSQGESLASIARKYGFPDWRKIYNADANKSLRDKRPNPQVLYPGDEVVIPDVEAKQETLATDQKHKIKVKTSRWMFRLDMKDEQMQALADLPFELRANGKLIHQGRTDSQGRIEVPLNPDLTSGQLLFMGQEYNVQLGSLDPISRVSGVQARLNNLGFACGPVDGKVGKLTRQAVMAFQQAQGDLKVSGEIDDATRARLLELHDKDTKVTAAEEDMGPAPQEPAAPKPKPEPVTADWDDDEQLAVKQAWSEDEGLEEPP